MADVVLIPQFNKKQAVRISIFDKNGKIKDELARKALPYYAQVAEVISVSLCERFKKVVLVYKVRLEDGTVLQLTEDCLMPIKNRY